MSGTKVGEVTIVFAEDALPTEGGGATTQTPTTEATNQHATREAMVRSAKRKIYNLHSHLSVTPEDLLRRAEAAISQVARFDAATADKLKESMLITTHSREALRRVDGFDRVIREMEFAMTEMEARLRAESQRAASCTKEVERLRHEVDALEEEVHSSLEREIKARYESSLEADRAEAKLRSIVSTLRGAEERLADELASKRSLASKLEGVHALWRKCLRKVWGAAVEQVLRDGTGAQLLRDPTYLEENVMKLVRIELEAQTVTESGSVAQHLHVYGTC